MKIDTEPDIEAMCDGQPVHAPSHSPSSQLSHPATYEDKYRILRTSSIGDSPNAFKRQSSSGTTLKLKPSKNGESTIAIEKGTHYT